MGAGSVEICTVTFMLNVDESSTISAEGKLDTCGSVSFPYSSHLQQVKDCRKYCLGDGGETKPLLEAGVLHMEPWNEAGVGKGKKILCHKCDEDVGNTDRILLSSLRTIRNANIDISHGQVVGWNFFPSFVFAGQGC